MNIIDLLLETDAKKLEESTTKKYEITRLSKVLGQKFEIEIHGLTSKKINELLDMETKDVRNFTILEAVKVDGKKLNNSKLMEKFGVVEPQDLLNKIFTSGELDAIYKQINELSGYKKDAVIEIKN